MLGGVVRTHSHLLCRAQPLVFRIHCCYARSVCFRGGSERRDCRGVNRLVELHQEYERIMQTTRPGVEQDQALSHLMDRIAKEFGVPLLHDPEWEQKHRPVIALYRKVSESRTTL